MRPLRLGSINIGGWSGRLDALQRAIVQQDLDLLFVCETWSARFSRPPHDWVILHSSWPLPTATGHAPYGVAFMLHPRWISRRAQFLCGDCLHPGLAATVSFLGVTYCGVYLPPRVSSDDCIRLLADVLPHDPAAPCFLVGDFNMRMGPRTGDTRSNPRGSLLPDWLQERCLSLCASPLGVPTFVSGPHSQSIVDYVWASPSALSLVSNVQVLSADDVGGTDHRLLWVSFRCPSQPLVAVSPRRFLRLRSLSDPARASALCASAHGLLSARSFAPSTGTLAWLDELSSHIASSLLRAAREVLGEYTPRPSRFPFGTPEVQRARRLRKAAFRSFEAARVPATQESRWLKYKQARATQRRAVRQATSVMFDRFSAHLTSKPRTEQTRMISAMARHRRQFQSHSLSGDATSLSSYATHFTAIVDSSHLGASWSPLPCLALGPISAAACPFTPLQVTQALCSLPTGKAPGRSGLPNELLRVAADVVTPWVFALFSAVWHWGLCPTAWTEAHLFPLHKRGDRAAIHNYRPISLTESLRKAFERLLLPALSSAVELDICQGGFRPQRGTLEQVACLHDAVRRRRALLRAWPHLAFLDIRSAYDSVHRPLLWDKLRSRSVPPALIRVLQSLFDHNVSRVVVLGAESTPFHHRSGLLQGSVLSPLLYSVFIDELPAMLRAEGRPGQGSVPVASFLYADDIALVADSPDHLQRLLDLCSAHAQSHGYRFAPDKCVHVAAGPSSPVVLEGRPIPQASSFCYLGVEFGATGIMQSVHARARVDALDRPLSLLRSLGFNGVGLSAVTRRALYHTFLRPVLEYGVPLLPNVHPLQTLQHAQTRALRFMFSTPPATSTDAVHFLAGVHPMATRASLLRAAWLRRAHAAGPGFLIHHAVSESRRSTTASVLRTRRRFPLPVDPDDSESFAAADAAFLADATQILSTAVSTAGRVPLPSGAGFGDGLRLLDGYSDRRCAFRVGRWLLGFPFSPLPHCQVCGAHRATLHHVEHCALVCISDMLRQRNWEGAARALQYVALRCAGWLTSWRPHWTDPALRATHAPGRPP